MSLNQGSAASDDETLQLRSEDGVLFAVQKYHLKSASAVFRDMLAIPKQLPSSKNKDIPSSDPASPSTNPPIDIAYPSEIVQLFINLIQHGALGSPDDLPNLFPAAHALYGRKGGVNILFAVVELLEQFDCAAAIRERAFNHFQPLFRADPWGVYCLAAKYEDLVTARMAIRSMHDADSRICSKISLDAMSTQDAGRVPLNWLMGYFQAETDVTYLCPEFSSRGQQEYWDRMASWLKIRPA